MKPRMSKPPSRVRYEQSHPTVSVRVSRDLYDRLDSIRKGEGKSFADILREAVGVQEATAKAAYERGREDGVETALAEMEAEAEQRYRVPYRCGRCGGWMEIQSEEEKVTVRMWIEGQDWRHARCPQRPAPTP